LVVAHTLLLRCDERGPAFSTGSACHGEQRQEHVHEAALSAMSRETLRFSSRASRPPIEKLLRIGREEGRQNAKPGDAARNTGDHHRRAGKRAPTAKVRSHRDGNGAMVHLTRRPVRSRDEALHPSVAGITGTASSS
jgi:hypothetical protein